MDLHTEPTDKAKTTAKTTKPATHETDKDYSNYVWVRDEVLGVLRQQKLDGIAAPSEYWSEELAGFDYMLEASPLLFRKLRQQSYHLTGIKHYEYRSSQTKLRDTFALKLAELKKADKTGLFIPESPALGGFGHTIDGQLVNIDTLKFYESLIALDRGGVLEKLKANPRSLVLEIGAGWGGFAYQLLKTCPNTTYVVVDFPEVILFSASYLKTMFPGSRALVVKNEADKKELQANARDYDFIFIPQEKFNDVWDQPADLAVNMVSFQEMTSEQVDNYAKHLAETGTKCLYSHNRDKSKHNAEISAVSEILARHFELKRIAFLDGDYTNFNAKVAKGKKAPPPPAQNKIQLLTKKVANRYRRFVKEKLLGEAAPPVLPKGPKPGTEWMLYRHLIGAPRSAPSNA